MPVILVTPEQFEALKNDPRWKDIQKGDMTMQRYVCGFLFDERNTNVLLMLKARPAWQKGMLNGVGGHIEKEETPEQAMGREWAEETDGLEMQWMHFATLSGEDFEVFFYRATGGTAFLTSQSDEEHLVVCDPAALPTNVIPNLKYLIPMASFDNRRDWPYGIHERSVSGGSQ